MHRGGSAPFIPSFFCCCRLIRGEKKKRKKSAIAIAVDSQKVQRSLSLLITGSYQSLPLISSSLGGIVFRVQ
jgi:hypothetical protein